MKPLQALYPQAFLGNARPLAAKALVSALHLPLLNPPWNPLWKLLWGHLAWPGGPLARTCSTKLCFGVAQGQWPCLLVLARLLRQGKSSKGGHNTGKSCPQATQPVNRWTDPHSAPCRARHYPLTRDTGHCTFKTRLFVTCKATVKC